MSERIPTTETLPVLLARVRACRHCADLPLGPNPVLRVDSRARILVIGQAPGTRVHATGIPWNDPSGDRLRAWMGIDRETFYDEALIAIMPMGFCYPGRGKSGDLPPPPACAPLWHPRLLAHLPAVELVLLIGQYAQRHYLAELGLASFASLTATVRNGPAPGGALLPPRPPLAPQPAVAQAQSLVRRRGGTPAAGAGQAGPRPLRLVPGTEIPCG